MQILGQLFESIVLEIILDRIQEIVKINEDPDMWKYGFEYFPLNVHF